MDDINRKICPLCGKNNNCQHGEEKCWCYTVEIPNAIVDMIPKDKKGKACVCRECIDKYKEQLSG